MIRKLVKAALLVPIGAVMLMAAPAAAHDPGDSRYWKPDGRHSEWRDRRDDRYEWREERRERLRDRWGDRREARQDRREDRRERWVDHWDDKRDRFNRRHRLWAEQHHNSYRGREHAQHQGWRNPYWVPPQVQRRQLERRYDGRRHGPWPAWRY